MGYISDLSFKIRAGFSMFYVPTHEEDRVIFDTINVAKDLQYNLFTWDCVNGLEHRILLVAEDKEVKCYDLKKCTEKELRQIEGSDIASDAQLTNPAAMLATCRDQKFPKRSIVLALDFYHFFDQTDVLRECRNSIENFGNTHKKIVFVGAQQTIPLDLSKNISIVEYPLPNVNDIEVLLRMTENACKDANKGEPTVKDPVLRTQIINACRGMVTQEIQDALFLSYIINDFSWSDKCVKTINREKAQAIKKSGILEYFEPVETMNDVGGLDNLKLWILQRQKAYSKEAKEYGLQSPKGVLLLGTPGCVTKNTKIRIKKIKNDGKLKIYEK